VSKYEPRWDFTVGYGEDGEKTVAELLHIPDGSHIEVKRKSYVDDKFYVELEQSPHATGDFKPSGLRTTEADYWAFLIADTGVVVLVPTTLLQKTLAYALR
jgi:hypothetical protein